jgi:hypothetical protein
MPLPEVSAKAGLVSRSTAATSPTRRLPAAACPSRTMAHAAAISARTPSTCTAEIVSRPVSARQAIRIAQSGEVLTWSRSPLLNARPSPRAKFSAVLIVMTRRRRCAPASAAAVR